MNVDYDGQKVKLRVVTLLELSLCDDCMMTKFLINVSSCENKYFLEIKTWPAAGDPIFGGLLPPYYLLSK